MKDCSRVYFYTHRMTHKAAEPQVVGAELSLVQLTERDIPGAALEEPLEGHTVPALRWWLLCHGIQAPTSWKKPKLIER